MLNANKHRVGVIGEIGKIGALYGHIRRIVIFGILGISIGATFSLVQQQDLDAIAQVPPDHATELNPASPRPGDAELLRSSPGEPLSPTVASPLTFTDSPRVLPSAGVTPITFSIEPTTPVTPYIPSASPVSPARDVPGALTTDPLTAFPLFNSKTDK